MRNIVPFNYKRSLSIGKQWGRVSSLEHILHCCWPCSLFSFQYRKHALVIMGVRTVCVLRNLQFKRVLMATSLQDYHRASVTVSDFKLLEESARKFWEDLSYNAPWGTFLLLWAKWSQKSRILPLCTKLNSLSSAVSSLRKSIIATLFCKTQAVICKEIESWNPSSSVVLLSVHWRTNHQVTCWSKEPISFTKLGWEIIFCPIPHVQILESPELPVSESGGFLKLDQSSLSVIWVLNSLLNLNMLISQGPTNLIVLKAFLGLLSYNNTGNVIIFIFSMN